MSLKFLGRYKDIYSNKKKNGGFRRDRIAVEINGEIIKKSDYDKTVLNDGDKIEVVSFVGGG